MARIVLDVLVRQTGRMRGRRAFLKPAASDGSSPCEKERNLLDSTPLLRTYFWVRLFPEARRSRPSTPVTGRDCRLTRFPA
jgi:hypothetical protein